MRNIAVLVGDGVANEILESAIKVLSRVSEVYRLDFKYNYASIGGRAYDEVTAFMLLTTALAAKSSGAQQYTHLMGTTR